MSELLTSPSQVGPIVLPTLVVYVFILVGFPLAGKREVGPLAPFDLALLEVDGTISVVPKQNGD
jgi:uncharacterized membrane protein YcaP (DUF421 family)